MKNLEKININSETPIEELIEAFPLAVSLLSQYGIRCLICGEPSWGTIGSAAKEKYIDPEKLNLILVDLNKRYDDFMFKKGQQND